MATKIVLMVEEGLSVEEQKKLRYLLADAVSEFAAARNPAQQYVAKRYEGKGYDWMNRDEKVKEVQFRINLAQKIHGPVLSAEISSVEETKENDPSQG